MDVRQKRKELLDKAASQGISPQERDLLDALSAIQQVQGSLEQHPEIVRARQEANRIQADRAFELICRVNYNGKKLIVNEANKQQVLSWYDEARDGTVDNVAAWFVKCLNENPALANTVTWESADPGVRQTAAKIQAEQDDLKARELLKQYGHSTNEANVRYLIDFKNEEGGGTWAEVEGFLRSNLLSSNLAPASPAERIKWDEQAAQERQRFLRNATSEQLHKTAKVETPVLRQQAQQAQADRALASAQARFEARGGVDTSGSGHGYPPLPEKYDPAAIKAMGGQEFRQLIKRYGDHQINIRLRQTA